MHFLVNRLFPIRWLASILLIFVVDVTTYLALARTGGPQMVDNQDKFLHVIGFFGLFCLGYVSLSFDFFRRFHRFSKRLALLNAMIWMSYGLFIEAIQGISAHRVASVKDLIANGLGIVLGAIFVLYFRIHPTGAEVEDAAR